ncbi:UDP-glucose/GDP-mannose dehydrogenase family protein [Mesobacillus boroniphilus]|uniref:UDP-glucose 6-dehydrogenase n=1 Tax=Mesobacillus boroniphilus TaxID=308892 RepID=A0A944CPG5_9BACI|nr:UDP-glucose/GDP-mannose dehydrogenase family protein [Mesobacillus boroniphilus]MBS8266162.1 UDP-glucose/GDP-mannose dehydrogenase family protein [Mesobacillus boroniphilus]
MKVAVLGTGYVGLSTGICLAEIGHNVICIDIDERKINTLKEGKSPIYEPGLEELLIKNSSAGRLTFTTSHQYALNHADIIIIAVGTPQSDDGQADLSFLERAAKDLAENIVRDSIVVVKSTVPVGTNEYLKQLLLGQLKNKVEIKMVSNPEFLRQGSAIQDTLKADRIIIGSDDAGASEIIQEMYRPLNVPFLLTDVRSAEMIKYASNAFLATKISFINGIANLCEAVGADVEDVAKGMGYDKRIGSAFLKAGIGYGGSCFPKDVKALLHTSKEQGIPFSLLEETIAINDHQQELLVGKALKRLGELKGKKIAMLGLSFKPETDDMRDAPSIKIAHALTAGGAEVTAYDPVASGNARKVIGEVITYVDSAFEAAKGADALFIVTEWEEFRQLEFEALLDVMKQRIIFDGRNCLDEAALQECSPIEYYPVGRPAVIMKDKKV